MTLSLALHAALSGLTAASRASGVVSENIANALTPGYARRSIILDSQSDVSPGVRVLGIERHVDLGFVGTPVDVATRIDVRRGVDGIHAAQPGPVLGLQRGVGGLHVGEQRVAASAVGQDLHLEHGGGRGFLVAGHVGVPAVAVGDGGVPVGADDEDGGVLVLGGCGRVFVEGAESAGEVHLDVGRQWRLPFEGQDAVVEPGRVEGGECGVVDPVGQVDTVDLGTEHR